MFQTAAQKALFTIAAVSLMAAAVVYDKVREAQMDAEFYAAIDYPTK